MQPTSTSPVPTKTNLVVAYRVTTHLFAIFVLVQAVMAGQIVAEGEMQTAHGILGNITFLLGVAGLVLAIVVRAPKSAITLAAALIALLVLQIALGYSGRDSAGATAWHIPNGVLIFGLATWQLMLGRRLATTE
jgi:hypothetical protein